MGSRSLAEQEMIRLMAKFISARLIYGPESQDANEALRVVIKYAEDNGEDIRGESMRRAWFILAERERRRP